jgi:hypothetical protein
MRKLFPVLAVLAIGLVVAGPAMAAKCDMLSEEAVERLKKLRTAMEQADEKNQADAKAIADFLPTFKRNVEDVEAGFRAIEAHEKKKPEKDIKKTFLGADFLAADERSKTNQADVKRWEADKLDLEAALDTKLGSLQSAINALGNWRGGVREFFSPTEDFGRARDDVREALRELGDKGQAPTREYDALFHKLLDGKVFIHSRFERKIKPAGANTGMLDAAEETRKKKKEARKQVIEFENKCPAAVARLEVDATRGREDDANDTDRRSQTGGNGNTNSPAVANGNTNNSGGEDTDLTAITEEGPSGNGTSTVARNTNTPAAPANTNTASTNTGGGGGGGDASYTVTSGDNLTKIARKLAAQLGNPDIQQLVSVLYQNMKTTSKDNPNLIFPGDTIDLEAVRKQLAA